MLRVETSVGLALHLVAPQKVLHEYLDLIGEQKALVVGVDGVVYIPAHFKELFGVNKNVSQVLNSFLVVYQV